MLSKKITYTIGKIPNTEAIINVYNSSGIIRPTDDKARIKKMYDNGDEMTWIRFARLNEAIEGLTPTASIVQIKRAWELFKDKDKLATMGFTF